ncbi:hypothetical protein D1610_02585 [Sphingomonas gilva]|uniref:DUF202 domain-containing protein n=1 Tax=Sphingomonas gilva TaxID=2305907 RepID=A0A396RSJ4_9SPHN|nr:hypothetical protein [Sphingomonas gilva]RHW19036.1 hypothetical protein D1610_02585 [Sphingomonas gilva]
MTDPARNRFFLMGVSRVLGVALAMAGLVWSQRADSTVEIVAAVALIILALAIIAFLPRSLARRWRTPPE